MIDNYDQLDVPSQGAQDLVLLKNDDRVLGLGLRKSTSAWGGSFRLRSSITCR